MPAGAVVAASRSEREGGVEQIAERGGPRGADGAEEARGITGEGGRATTSAVTSTTSGVTGPSAASGAARAGGRDEANLERRLDGRGGHPVLVAQRGFALTRYLAGLGGLLLVVEPGQGHVELGQGHVERP